jgi:VIT1/CCC1 family predicted Fe2+/Mn2+ transporter
MAHEALRNSILSRTLVELLGDLSDLLTKEIRLARAEIADKLQRTVRASVWSAVAALLGLIAFFFLLEALVFALISFGLAAYWACLIVAALLAGSGAAAFAIGRSAAPQEMSPSRSIRQINADIRTAKELVT